MPEQPETSEFNNAIATVNRMNMYFCICGQASGNQDPYQWFFQGLMPLSRELSDDMKPEDIKKDADYYHKLAQTVQLWTMEAMKGKKAVKPELYDLLDQFERFLRKVHRVAGYKTKFKDDPRFAR